MLLVFLVNHRAGIFKACPYLVAQVFCHRSNLTELFMQLLKLMESAYHIRFFGQFFSLFTQVCFLLEVLFEIVFACFAVQVQQVVELLYVKLICLPRFVCLLRRHCSRLLPFLLQLLKGVKRFVCLLRRGGHIFYFLNDFFPAFQVFGAFFFLLPEGFCTLFFYYLHFSLKCFFFVIGANLILFGVAASLDIGFLLFFALSNVQTIECRFKVFNLFFIWIFLVMGNLSDAFEHLFL